MSFWKVFVNNIIAKMAIFFDFIFFPFDVWVPMIEDSSYEYFLAALKEWIAVKRKNNEAPQKILAIEIGCHEGTISKFVSSNRTKPIPYEKQVALANACGFDYFSFLHHGKQLLDGEYPKNLSKKIVPIDAAVQFLNECIKEAGAGDYLNDKQKQALLKVIRDELKSAEEKAKTDIKKYLNVLKG